MRNELTPDIAGRVGEFIRSELVGDSSDLPIHHEADLIDGGLLDSLGIFELITFIEESFQVSIDADDVASENFRSIDAIAELIAIKQMRA